MLNRLTEDVREMLQEQVTYRELLVQMTRRDLLLRYKQTVMGFGWAIFMPLLNTVIFSVIFTRVAPLDTGMPYPLFAYCGLLVWNFFASSLRFAVSFADGQHQPRDEGVFPARDLSVLSGGRVAGRLRRGGDGSGGDDDLLPRRAPASHAALPAGRAGGARGVHGGRCRCCWRCGNLFYRDVKYLFEVVLTVWMFASVGGLPGATGRRQARRGAAAEPDDADHRCVSCRAPARAACRRRAPFAAAAVLSFATLASAGSCSTAPSSEFAENV